MQVGKIETFLLFVPLSFTPCLVREALRYQDMYKGTRAMPVALRLYFWYGIIVGFLNPACLQLRFNATQRVLNDAPAVST